jgi:hypothetical protein
MDEHVAKVRDLLHEAAETHHIVYRITDGTDEDWASWYAEWLTHLSELADLLGGPVVRSHLTHALVSLDREFTAKPPGTSWEEYYAEQLVSQFSR